MPRRTWSRAARVPAHAPYDAINVAASKRKELVRNVEQLGRQGVAIIFCFRASEKVRPRKKGQAGGGDDDSKMVEMGYMPDTKESLMFLMTASMLLMPRAKGVPTLQPEKPGEQLMVKVPGYFAGLFNPGEQLNEAHGRRMAEWARGGVTESLIGPEETVQRIQHDHSAAMLKHRADVDMIKKRFGKLLTAEKLSELWERNVDWRLTLHEEAPDLEKELNAFYVDQLKRVGAGT